jgi:diaminopimelate decarboxylase
MAVAAGVVIHIESLTQLHHATRAAKELNRRALIGVRINPPFELKSSGMKMSGGSSPFGIDLEQLDTLWQQFDREHLQFEGLHFFCGSQNLNAQQIIAAQQQIFALVRELWQALPQTPRYINIGGGFGVPYFAGDTDLDVARIGQALQFEMTPFKSYAPNTQIVIELGRYLVAEAGLYICEILDKKISRGCTYLVCNGGLHHHLSAVGLLGQVIRKNYPIVIATKMASDEREVVNIVGPLCTPLDCLAQQAELAKAEIGDLIAVLQSGAYGLSASPRAFLSHPDAVELVL